MPARKHRGGPPALAVFESLAQARQIELRDTRSQRGELTEQLLGALGGSRLERQRPQPLLDLGLDVACALDLDPDARELELGAMLAALEPSEPCGLLQQRAPLLRLRAEDLLDPPLPDDRVHPAAEPEIGEQLDEIDATDGGAIQQVLALSPAMEPAGDGELGVRQRPFAVGVVEEQLDLAEVFAGTAAAAGEEHVVGLLGAKLRGSHRPGRPDDCVGDVGLPGAVGPHDHGNARLEANLDRFRERLEAAQLDGA